jgi:hypothetical protein
MVKYSLDASGAQRGLAKRLAANRRVTFGLVSGAIAAALVASFLVFVWPSIAASRAEAAEFDNAKNDFGETWCSTYGQNPEDPGAEQWLAYVDRHREFLNDNFATLGMTSVDLDGVSTRELMIEGELSSLKDGLTPSVGAYWNGFAFPQHFAFFGFGGDGGEAPSC